MIDAIETARNLKMVKATPSKVEFGLTIPKELELDGSLVGFQELIAKFEKNLQALPEDEEYQDLDGRGYETHKTKPDFIVFKTLIINFAKEDT